MALHEQELSGILADEMGLGKTLETISAFAYLDLLQKEKNIKYDNMKMKHIVIVPKSVITNWKNEFERWCPSLRVFVA